MKKLLCLVVLAAVIATGTAFAQDVHPSGFGIGALWGGAVDNGFHHNVALSLKIPDMPVFWGISGRFSDSWSQIGVQGDVYLMGSYLVDTLLGWFFGVGLYGNFGFNDHAAVIGFGGRFPVGLTIQPVELLEIFFNAAPQIGGGIWVSGDNSGFDFPRGGFFNFEIGLRFWF
jgi:opacity protein-like surface antigen